MESLYGGSTMWQVNRARRDLTQDTSFTAKTIGLMFRTVKPDGILIYAATNKHFTSIEVRDFPPKAYFLFTLCRTFKRNFNHNWLLFIATLTFGIE